MSDEVIRSEAAMLFKGSLKSQSGTLLLFPDRLSHVAAAVHVAGAAFGAIGALVAGKTARNRAVGKELEGGKGVITLPLTQLTEVRKAKQGINNKLMEIQAADGTVLKLGVKFDQWKPDLLAALEAAGRSVHDAGDVITVS